MRILASICLFAVLGGCATRHDDCQALVAGIRNDHIAWDGNLFGLLPQIRDSGVAERGVLASGHRCIPLLIDALGDDARFISAHVLLTFIRQPTFPRNENSAAYWNGLEVTLYADGHVDIPVAQKDIIKKLWTQR